MRASLPVCAISAVVALGLALHANEKPSAEYQKAMQDIGAAAQQLRADIKELQGLVERGGDPPSYMAVEKDTAILKAAFATIVAFWNAKKTDDAMKLANAAAKATADLETAVKEMDFEGITKAAGAMSGTCNPCHTAHRERLPDGTFEIK
jgi:hypothetical protein